MSFAFFRRRAALAAALFGMAGSAFAAGSASPWITSTDSKVRLVSGTVDIDGAPVLVAGVQLRMEPGWKTYWRNPGDSGVPPSFDFAGSKNLILRARTKTPLCWILRLNRLSKLSNDSPSFLFTSTNYLTSF